MLSHYRLSLDFLYSDLTCEISCRILTFVLMHRNSTAPKAFPDGKGGVEARNVTPLPILRPAPPGPPPHTFGQTLAPVRPVPTCPSQSTYNCPV